MNHRPGPLSERIQLSLTPAMLAALHSYCAETGLTTGQAIRHLLNKLLADKLGFPDIPRHG